MATGALGRTRTAARLSVVREVVLVGCGVVLYFGVRGLTVENASAAVRNAHRIVSWETAHGLYVEPALQSHIDGSRVLTTAMNWVYIWGHWPVIAMTLLWLVRRHPATYRVTRNAMLASGGIGLAVFALYPLAPPRLAGLGLVDTVTEQSSSYRYLQPKAFVNQYAAMPSLHVGWDLLIGIAVVTSGRHLLLRIVGAALPVLMVLAVLTTANHYVLDVCVGIALVLICRAVMVRLERRHRPEGNGDADPDPGIAARGVLPRPRAAQDDDVTATR